MESGKVLLEQGKSIKQSETAFVCHGKYATLLIIPGITK